MMLINNGDQTFSVTNGTTVVFTGTIVDAMKEHARLSLAARAAAVVTPKKAARLAEIRERKQAGVR